MLLVLDFKPPIHPPRVGVLDPTPSQSRGRWFDRPKPATAIAEGGVGENGEQAKADLLVYLARRERVGGGRSAMDGGLAAVCKGGDGAPVDNSGEKWADEDQ